MCMHITQVTTPSPQQWTCSMTQDSGFHLFIPIPAKWLASGTDDYDICVYEFDVCMHEFDVCIYACIYVSMDGWM